MLREFTLLQTFRSYGTVEKLLAMSERHYSDLKDSASGKNLPPRMLEGTEDAVMMAIRQFLETRHYVRDLDMCLIVNETRA